MEFLKRIFGKDKGEEKKTSENVIVATLNDKIQPIDRGEVYEDPLDEFIQTNGIGEVTGGGTMQLESGEIEFCDIVINLNSAEIDEKEVSVIINKLEALGAPKGSKILIEKNEKIIHFGKLEGIGIYIENVSEEKEYDLNKIFNDLLDLLEDKSIIVRSWQGQEEVGLYYYATSFFNMKTESEKYFDNLKLTSKVRYEQIA